jgi:hypothetical protein
MTTNKNESAKVWFIPESGDKKTGRISVTYTDNSSCPARCPFKGHGCYAENFPCCLQWKKAPVKGVVASELKQVINNSAHTNVIRHNVAGDLGKNNSNNIDKDLLDSLITAYEGLTAYTYTHTAINKHNVELVKKASDKGFVINFSTETVKDMKKAVQAGCNAVITVNSMENNVTTVEGVKIVKCPNSYKDNMQCKNCGLCWLKNRKFVVAFPVHGNKKRAAKENASLIDL